MTKKAKVKLVGRDGNAWAILGRVVRAMRDAGVAETEIAEYMREATGGDYDHLLRTTMRYVDLR
jgi:hypothetical protein